MQLWKSRDHWVDHVHLSLLQISSGCSVLTLMLCNACPSPIYTIHSIAALQTTLHEHLKQAPTKMYGLYGPQCLNMSK